MDDHDSSEQPFDAVKAAAEFAAAMAKDPHATSSGDSPSPGPDRYTAMLEEEVETLKALLGAKEAALAAAEQRAASALADVDKVRARIERSAAATIENKRRSVIASFLDVADGLDRAVAELSTRGVSPALAQGILAVRAELQSALKRHGAEHRPSIGLPFDSAHHEAVATAPATADAPDGTITAVLSEGYVLEGATLRAARVVVAKA